MSVASREQIQRACERAALYRRAIALETGARQKNLEQHITFVPSLAPRSIGDPEWFSVGSVLDSVVGRRLAVHWNPATDEVKVELPPEPEESAERPEAVEEPLPIAYSLFGRNHYPADDRYRFFLEGQEYTAKEASRIANKRKNLDGWTWELKQAVDGK